MRLYKSAVVGAVVLLASLLGLPAALATTPPAPPVGACYDYGWAGMEAASNSSPRVSCSSTHTAKTLATGTFAAGTTLSTVFSATNAARIARTCLPALKKADGTGWAKYEEAAVFYDAFRPTDAQWSAGARWFRCDAMIPGVNRLFALPNANPLIGTSALTTRTRLCMNSVGPISCKESHIYRVVGTFTVASTTYPTASAWDGAAQRRCPAVVTTNRYAWRYPSKTEFSLGDKVVSCFNYTVN